MGNIIGPLFGAKDEAGGYRSFTTGKERAEWKEAGRPYREQDEALHTTPPAAPGHVPTQGTGTPNLPASSYDAGRRRARRNN